VKHLIDTCIFNNLLAGKLLISDLPQDGEYVATHLQYDELSRAPDIENKKRLLSVFEEIDPETLPTGTGVLDVPAWVSSKWGEGELLHDILMTLDGLNNEKKNNINDALIVEVAIKHGYCLLTSDRDLAHSAGIFGCRVKLLEF
jgi:hypothetical protein